MGEWLVWSEGELGLDINTSLFGIFKSGEIPINAKIIYKNTGDVYIGEIEKF